MAFLQTKRGYFIIDSLTGNCQLFISIASLVNVLKLKLKTILNGISLNRTNQITKWIHFKALNTIYILYESIPIKSLNKLKLPVDSNEMFNYLKSIDLDALEVFKNMEYLELETAIFSRYRNRYAPYIKHYKDDFKTIEERIRYAKMHGLFEFVIELRSKRFPEAAIFHVVCKLYKSEVLEGRRPVFITSSHRTFFNKTRTAVTMGIRKRLINGHKGVERPEQRKVTDQIEAYIKKLMRDKKKFFARKIASRVQRKFGIKLSTTRILQVRDKETKNLVNFVANGSKYSRNNSIPKLKIELADGPGEIFLGDYYTEQFICRRPDGEISRVIAYHVIDGFSTKVVGWSLMEVKSEFAAIDAFKMAILDCAYLPGEIWIDNDPFYAKPAFLEFIVNLTELGVIYEPPAPGLATARAKIESFHSAIQKLIFSDKDFYLGEGVTSRNFYGNPAKELIDKYYSQINKIPFINDFRNSYRNMIINFNAGTYDEEETFA